MRKHAFLVRWQRIGRTVSPVLDSYSTCLWPLAEDDQSSLAAKALVAMIDGYDNLPDDVKKFCHAYWGMSLRLRYSNGDTTGPYLINDVDETLTEEGLEGWLSTISDAELARYHSAAPRVNRRRSRYG